MLSILRERLEQRVDFTSSKKSWCSLERDKPNTIIHTELFPKFRIPLRSAIIGTIDNFGVPLHNTISHREMSDIQHLCQSHSKALNSPSNQEKANQTNVMCPWCTF